VLSGSNEKVLRIAGNTPTSPTLLYSATIVLSAFLLFQIQPILAKLILPWFGGAAAVWLVSLAFYQSSYFLGNLYAHFLTGRGRARWLRGVHAAFLLATLSLLPIVPSPFWQPRGSEEPTWRIFGLLAATVGAPFLLLSATSPLLQAWYSIGREAPRPYRLYALSNLGSLLALVSYPLVVEPAISTHGQVVIWSVAYGIFVILCSALTFRAPSLKLPSVAQSPTSPIGWTLPVLWLFLAACASALLVSVTNHVSQNIAAIPLLWIVPLSLYLLTLILCFAADSWYRRVVFLPVLPIALAVMAWLLSPQFESASPRLQIPIYFAGLFICCTVCHGEMAALKPAPELLTMFYLTISAGGAMGGIFVALVAPRVFRGLYEFPLALGLCAISVFFALLRNRQFRPDKRTRAAPFLAATITAALVAIIFQMARVQSGQALLTVRNFYGVLRVNILPPGPVRPAVTQLRNGTVVHGEEILNEPHSDGPTTYYGEHSGIGIALLFARQSGNVRVGVIGLGVGTLARYGQMGDDYVFYEINPQVTDLATNLFDFLHRSDAQVEIIPGDGRLSLQRQSPQNFDVLVVDAFSGDAIPVHLLTREAFELYFRHLKPHGLLAMHVTNRLLNLPPVIEATACGLGARAVQVTNSEDEKNAVYQSTWVLLDRASASNATVSNLTEGRISLPSGTSAQIQHETGVRAWTDNYSNLIGILNWRHARVTMWILISRFEKPARNRGKTRRDRAS